MIAVPPHLTGDGVTLRPPRADDAAALAAAFVADRDLGRLIGVDADPDEAQLRERLGRAGQTAREDRAASLVIADPRTDACWGSLVAHSFDTESRRCEVGFYLIPEARRQGRGTRAVAAALRWLFADLDLLRVEMTTTPDNEAIHRLAARLGFVVEGTMRRRNIERGRRVDIVMFGLLREDWDGD